MGCGLCSSQHPADVTKAKIQRRGPHLGSHTSSVQTLWLRRHSPHLEKLSLSIIREVCSYLGDRKLAFLDLTNGQVQYLDVDRRKWQRCWTLRYSSEKEYYFRRAKQYAWVVISDYVIFICGGVTPAIWDVGGGYYEGIACNDASFLKDDGRDYRLPMMGVARYKHGIFYRANEVYVFGGVHDLEGDHPIRVCEKYSISTNQWETLPDMHSPRYCFNPCWHLSVLYLCGGFCTSLETFDLVSNTMTLLPDLTLPEGGSCIAGESFEGELVVLTEHYMCKMQLWGLEWKTHSPYQHYVMSPPLVQRGVLYVAGDPYSYGISLDTGESFNI